MKIVACYKHRLVGADPMADRWGGGVHGMCTVCRVISCNYQL